MINLLIGYWALTTILAVRWVIKNPSARHGDDQVYFTLFDVFGSLFPCALLGWICVPITLLYSIKFKR